MRPDEKIYSALVTKYGKLNADFIINHVRQALTSNTGKFFVREVSDVQIHGSRFKFTLACNINCALAPDYESYARGSFKLDFDGSKYHGKLQLG